MKKVFTIVFLFLSAVFIAKAQSSEFKNKTIDSSIKGKEIAVQLTPFGYISLPKGYWAYMDADYMDAWGGVIEPLKESSKIVFSDGLVASVFDGKDKNLKWKKYLETENGTITYALVKDKKSKHILAKIWTANFSTEIKDDSDIERFLEIIKRYRRGRCENCFYSKNTKQLRKIFERQTKND